MASFVKFYCFSEDLAKKKHNLGSDQLVVALCASANAPSISDDAVLADVTQISYTNLSSRNLSTVSCVQTAGVCKLLLSDLTLTASGGAVAAFRYVLIYNDTATNDELIGYYDRGSDLTLSDGEALKLDFTDANGIIWIT